LIGEADHGQGDGFKPGSKFLVFFSAVLVLLVAIGNWIVIRIKEVFKITLWQTGWRFG
jgi:hypothetical protein